MKSGFPSVRTTEPAPKPTSSNLGFGKLFTDHVFVAEHEPEKGWHSARIVPQKEASVSAASGAVQYGLSVFEGLKAHRGLDGSLRLFRPDAHARRLNESARRLCMPEADPSWLLAAMRAIVDFDADWYPEVPGGSLYLRPTLFGDEEFLGVRPAHRHTLCIFLSPVTGYFADGVRALRLWAERENVRAVPGGVGSVKTGGNYAASLLAAQRAQARGCDQVLWLDAHEHRHLEEVGTMNVFVRIGDRVITPPLDGTILAGVTRDSCLALLRGWGIATEERRIAMDELADAAVAGTLEEIWGSGTAAVVAPVSELKWDRGTIVPKGSELALRLRRALTELFAGAAADTHGWLQPCTDLPAAPLEASP